MIRDVCYYALFIVLLCLHENVGGIIPRHECQRLCDGKSPPKNCFYSFHIGISPRILSNSKRKLFLSINQTWPSPLIEVCQNDRIVVEVKNRLPSGGEESLHWHGFTEGNSPFMDGVPMVTQCPITSHQSFSYYLNAVQSGTFFYRSHYVAHQLDGLFGPLIVHDGKDQVHRSETVMISPLLDNLQTFNYGYERNVKVIALQTVVYSEFVDEYQTQDEGTRRWRLINGAALNCPVTLFSPSVPLTVIAIDGQKVEPKIVDRVTLYPDDRVDVIAPSEMHRSARLIGRELCRNLSKVGLSDGVDESEDSEMDVKEMEEEEEEETSDLTDFRPEVPENLEKSDLNLFLPFDVSTGKNFAEMVDFRFKLGGLTTYTPSFLGQQSRFYQTYNKTFLYPPSPLLSQPDDVPGDIQCGLTDLSKRCLLDDSDYCECVGVVGLPYDKNVDLFVIDEGKNSNVSQTVHVHGYSFYVVASKSYDKAITEAKVREEEKLGKIARNLFDPLRKDSVVVPNKGFVVLRLKTNRTGMWLIESQTSKALSSAGFELVLKVQQPDERVPKGFPKCGTLKGPDLVIID